MALKLITAASTYPVTLAEAKLHCRVDTSDDDALITALITTASEFAEQKLGRALLAQTWELTLDEFPDAFELTRTPVQSITSVKYYDVAGVQQTMSGSAYSLDSSDDNGSAFVVPAVGTSWPVTYDQINAVAVRFVAGYANAAAVPEPIKSWVKLQIGALYDNRAAASDRVMFDLGIADRLIDRYKVWT